MGQKECDDGNTVSGDGCSSECRVEPGFECTAYPDSPDVCVDVLPPTATMQLHTGNVLTILFSEEVLSVVNNEELVKTMEVVLKNKCKLEWTLLDTFTENTVFTTLQIKASPKCSFDRGGNTYIVHFKSNWLIEDTSGNALATNTLTAKAQKYEYAESEEAAAAVGAVIKYTTLGTFVFMVFLSLFQGYAVSSFCHFINMLQILSYLPVLNCELPSNYRIVLTEYLSDQIVALPFSLIPEFPYNPLNYLTVFLTEPLNEKFEEMDFESVSFIFNFSEELLS
eukprot:TRINITY_DN15501_c0_g1_i13.p1 TRINITY_DN15501_c0_g1~~TRINITY_DN15501_c0_g1_i13.p1  ORF type:complete len:281 (+),score=54.01 TRINITY_DN15501_c0_g1_i13:379-1221(+)